MRGRWVCVVAQIDDYCGRASSSALAGRRGDASKASVGGWYAAGDAACARCAQAAPSSARALASSDGAVLELFGLSAAASWVCKPLVVPEIEAAQSLLGSQSSERADLRSGASGEAGRSRICLSPQIRPTSPYARCRMWRERFCAHSKPIPIRDQRELQVGWARLALAPPSTSLDFSRSNARGRSDLHSPKDVRTSQTLVGQFDAARMQRRRRSARTASSVCAAATVACGLDSTATGSPRHGTGGRRITEAIFPRCSRSVTHGSDLDRLLY